MEIVCQRLDPEPGDHPRTTFGDLSIDGEHFCFTLEDQVREMPGAPVAQWKVKGETAIPAGRYRVTLEHSPRFGPETITIHGIEGFSGVRVHGGNDVDDTEGCPLVGNKIDRATGTISGAKAAGVLVALKAVIRAALARGDSVWWDVRNADV